MLNLKVYEFVFLHFSSLIHLVINHLENITYGLFYVCLKSHQQFPIHVIAHEFHHYFLIDGWVIFPLPLLVDKNHMVSQKKSLQQDNTLGQCPPFLKRVFNSNNLFICSFDGWNSTYLNSFRLTNRLHKSCNITSSSFSQH